VPLNEHAREFDKQKDLMCRMTTMAQLSAI